MKKVLCVTMAFWIVVCALTVSADSNYEEYIYATNGQSVEAPESYSPVKILYGDEETEQVFSAPRDIDVDQKGNSYILDPGNNRIVVYSRDFSEVHTIRPPVIGGETVSFAGCAGLFVTEKEIYISDKSTGRFYVLNKNGKGKRIIEFRPLPVVGDDFIFKPVHFAVDETGIIQVQAEGCFNGLITLDRQGNMLGYYSANSIQASLSVIAAQFWRKIFSDEQQDSIKQIIPVEYSSLTVDTDGFLYTTTNHTENSAFEIKKLNPYGDNILGYNDTDDSVKIGNGNYGDQRVYHSLGQDIDTTFDDIYVDADRYIFALDTTRGRVFQYDQNSNLICVFGGIGNQRGTFSLPAAVCGFGEQIYVLDSAKNSLTVFAPNEYVQNIRSAIALDEECDYAGAAEYWQKVYEKNMNYSLALSGLGKAARENGELKTAMEYFKRANDRVNYDIAYAAYRTVFIREHFIWIGLGFLAVVVAVLAGLNLKKRKGKNEA